MRYKWIFTVLTICILVGSAVSCKALPRVPEGAEDCPIWESDAGKIWAGVIDGTYSVSGVLNNAPTVIPIISGSVADWENTDSRVIEAAIKSLREIEPHILKRIEEETTENGNARAWWSDAELRGGIQFSLRSEQADTLEFTFAADRCKITCWCDGERISACYLLDTDSNRFVEKLNERLAAYEESE